MPLPYFTIKPDTQLHIYIYIPIVNLTLNLVIKPRSNPLPLSNSSKSRPPSPAAPPSNTSRPWRISIRPLAVQRAALPLRYLQADLPSSTTTQPAPIQAAIIHSAAPSFGSGNTPPHQQPWLSFPAGAAARAAAQPPDRIPPLQAGSQQPAATHATASSSPCWPRTSDGSQIHGSPSPCATCSRARSRPAPRPLRRDLHPSTSGRVTPLDAAPVLALPNSQTIISAQQDSEEQPKSAADPDSARVQASSEFF